jgi:hypothetical protein
MTRAKVASSALEPNTGDTLVEMPKHFPPFPPEHTFKRSDADGRKRQREDSGNGRDQSTLVSSRKSVRKSLSRIEEAAERSSMIGSRLAHEQALSSAAKRIPKLAIEGARQHSTINLNHVAPDTLDSLPKESQMLLGLGSEHAS